MVQKFSLADPWRFAFVESLYALPDLMLFAVIVGVELIMLGGATLGVFVAGTALIPFGQWMVSMVPESLAFIVVSFGSLALSVGVVGIALVGFGFVSSVVLGIATIADEAYDNKNISSWRVLVKAQLKAPIKKAFLSAFLTACSFPLALFLCIGATVMTGGAALALCPALFIFSTGVVTSLMALVVSSIIHDHVTIWQALKRGWQLLTTVREALIATVLFQLGMLLLPWLFFAVGPLALLSILGGPVAVVISVFYHVYLYRRFSAKVTPYA